MKHTPVPKPPRLRAGDTVAIVAPASPLGNRSELERAIAGLEGWGLTVRVGEHVRDRHGYLAGFDEDRAADLHWALADPEVRAVFGLQGGFGSPRLIPLFDEAVFRKSRSAICGYSDITTIHLARQRWSGGISFYSNGASGVGSPETSAFSKATMHRALFSDEPYGPIPRDPDDPYVRTLAPGRATGRLTGGCIGLVASTIGTRIQIDATDRILFLEDIPVEPEDLDGQLTHLRNAGILAQAAGIVLPHIEQKPSGYTRSLSIEDVLEELLEPLGIPVLVGLPVGHGKHHATVPFGALATLDATAGSMIVEEVVTADD